MSKSTSPPPFSTQSGKDRDPPRDSRAAGVIMSGNRGGAVVADQNALKTGARGPSLLEDFQLREKNTRFDQGRILERVVHAPGAFELYEGDRDDRHAK